MASCSPPGPPSNNRTMAAVLAERNLQLNPSVPAEAG